MLIKFKKPDPRAGQTVRMDSSRGMHFVAIGSADQVSERQDGDETPHLQQPEQLEQLEQPEQKAGKKPRNPKGQA